MTRFDFVKSFERVKEAARLLELIEFNANAHFALRELQPVLSALEFEVNRLKIKEGGN